MSASRRSLARLPLEIFEDLAPGGIPKPRTGTNGSGGSGSSRTDCEGQTVILTPEELRRTICDKLKRFRVRSAHPKFKPTSTSVTTVGDILRVSPWTLLLALDPLLTYAEIQRLVRRICHHCCPQPMNVEILLSRTTQDWKGRERGRPAKISRIDANRNAGVTAKISGESVGYVLPTGLPTLDHCHSNGSDLGGGIRLRSITEVVGRAGAGKTQLALQMVLMAARYQQGSIYIDTEKKLIVGRLREMAIETIKAESSRHVEDDIVPYSTTPPPPTVDEVLHNMTVKQPHSTDELVNVLEMIEEEILLRNQQSTSSSSSSSSTTISGNTPIFPVRVLIVDSIAAPLKRDFGGGPSDIPQRAAVAFGIAQSLKRLAEQLNLAVIVINQVGIDQQQPYGGGRDSGGRLRPDQVAVRASLGTSWHHCVSTRILVDHEIDPHRDGVPLHTSGGGGTSHTSFSNPYGGNGASTKDDNYPSHMSSHRTLKVLKSNWMPNVSCSFTITPTGIHESDSEKSGYNRAATGR